MELKLLLRRVVVYIMSVYYGLKILCNMVKLTCIHSYNYVFGSPTYPKPDSLSDPSLGDHGFIQLEQVKIHYVASGPEDKPLMLFLHGFPEFWYSWRHQIREFQKDYRCVAFDMRGYGESDKPVGVENYTLKVLMNDVKQMIQALGHQKCILVTHDWGGIVGWAFASLYPDMVEKFIVMNAPPTPVMTKALERKEQKQMSWYIIFFQLPFLPELFLRSCNYGFVERMMGKPIPYPAGSLLSNPYNEEVNADEIAAYKYTFSQPGFFTGPVNYYRALFLQRFSYSMDYQMPVLVLWGMKDFAIHTSVVDGIEEACEQATVVRFPEAGHFTQMDIPTKVNKCMREWLDRLDISQAGKSRTV